ncbi:hypothetical protein HMPREF0580_0287 [Mobiluncus mulieris ATCC 35239]|uniref:Uncharacterized protein n=1 Tax=Mobiluncus mulieris ATCC 35239 TaxID=871571 RepID=E0QN23_9ACTO|nr:hypothetical protein HMPREF0580_0287 [Mobiluncus mulieris ATCC 35239]
MPVTLNLRLHEVPFFGLMPINCVFNSVFWLVLCGKVGVV